MDPDTEIEIKEACDCGAELIATADETEKVWGVCTRCRRRYWLCNDCGRVHGLYQKVCDLPSVQMNKHDGYDECYKFFDPNDETKDPVYLQYPHTRIKRWMDAAEKVFNKKLQIGTEPLSEICKLYKIESININDIRKTMSSFERALRRRELQRFKPHKYGRPTSDTRFWEWAIGYARQIHQQQ